MCVCGARVAASHTHARKLHGTHEVRYRPAFCTPDDAHRLVRDPCLLRAQYNVLRQFPFDRIKAVRVMYESTHMSTRHIIAAAELMQAHGFANILGGLGKTPYVVWHHMANNASQRPGWKPAARRRKRALAV
eukprot:4238432-Prymnesium_polylepis.1